MWSIIKKLLQKHGGRIIIVEDGQPECVIMKIDEYEALLKSNETQEISQVNQEISQIKASETPEPVIEEAKTKEAEVKEEVKEEELPF